MVTFTRLRVALLSIMFLSAESALAVSTMGEAINEAGRQRMLSQKVAKAYFLGAIKPGSESAKRQLSESIKRFESNLSKLGAFPPARDLRPRLQRIDTQWQQYTSLLNQPISPLLATEVLKLSNEILKDAHQYVLELQAIAGTSTAELINISGRQRMLTQRMTKNFLANFWDGQDLGSQSAFYLDLAEFENALQYLLESDENTEEIRKKLLRVRGQLDYASMAFEGGIKVKQDRIIFAVTGTTDSMLYKMDEITRLYSELSDTGN
ncbi:MAG: type IV pili methyl-accepting chemotaxis transducer N-terminal domain-containing protein [Pseudomonadota bacterium]